MDRTGGYGVKIIVIEDNADLNDLLVEELVAEGFEATGHLSVEACTQAASHADLYLLDMNLPGESGLSFAARLRASRPEVGIVVLTVRTGSEIRTNSYDSGADIYLQKPCESAEIIAAIKSVARRLVRPVAQPALGLHPTRLMVSGPDGEAQVTVSEMALLCAMAAAADHQLSYAEVQALLGARNAPSLATLEVRITRLRKKIAAALQGEKTIISIRNVGYRVVVPVTVAASTAALHPSA